MPYILVSSLGTLIKTLLRKGNLKNEEFEVTVPGYSPSLGGSHMSLRQLLTSHPQLEWKEVDACLLSGLLAYVPLSFSTHTLFSTSCLGNGATQYGLDLPISINIIEMVPQGCAYKLTQYRQSLIETPSQGDSGLCQVGN